MTMGSRRTVNDDDIDRSGDAGLGNFEIVNKIDALVHSGDLRLVCSKRHSENLIREPCFIIDLSDENSWPATNGRYSAATAVGIVHDDLISILDESVSFIFFEVAFA